MVFNITELQYQNSLHISKIILAIFWGKKPHCIREEQKKLYRKYLYTNKDTEEISHGDWNLWKDTFGKYCSRNSTKKRVLYTVGYCSIVIIKIRDLNKQIY